MSAVYYIGRFENRLLAGTRRTGHSGPTGRYCLYLFGQQTAEEVYQ